MNDLYLEIGKSRKKIKLGRYVAKGAAGEIYKVEGAPGKVAKLYLHQQELAQYGLKVAAMIATPPELPPLRIKAKHYIQIAWPEARILDGKGKFRGFLMPEVDLATATELSNILQKAQRRNKKLPEFYGARVLLAANLSMLMHELHSAGHCMIDMKPENIRFYPGANYLAILDTDGFFINCTGGGKKYPSEQYSEQYIAPEAAQKLSKDLGVEQDLFALATIVFQLLNNGIHPFQGRDRKNNPNTIQERIFKNLYAYGMQSHDRVDPSPQSIHEFFEDSTRLLFDYSFTKTTGRPTALEWRDHLRRLISSNTLRRCSRNPGDHAHYSKGCGLCKQEERLAKVHSGSSLGSSKAKQPSQNTTPRRSPPVPPVVATKAQSTCTTPISNSPTAPWLILFAILTTVAVIALNSVSKAPSKAVVTQIPEPKSIQQQAPQTPTSLPPNVAPQDVAPGETEPGLGLPTTPTSPPELGSGIDVATGSENLESDIFESLPEEDFLNPGPIACLSESEAKNGFRGTLQGSKQFHHFGSENRLNKVEIQDLSRPNWLERTTLYNGLFILNEEISVTGKPKSQISITYGNELSEEFPVRQRTRKKIQLLLSEKTIGDVLLSGTITKASRISVPISDCTFDGIDISIEVTGKSKSGKVVKLIDDFTYSEAFKFRLSQETTITIDKKEKYNSTYNATDILDY